MDQQISTGIAAAPPGRSGVERLLAAIDRNHLVACAVLVLIALACFLPGIASIPAVDSDEARFVQATKQMLETGDYIDIRLGEEARYKKPVGIYWLQALAVRLTGNGADAPIWAYRLPSLLGAIAAVLLTYWTALPLFGRRAGFIAGTLLAVSGILVIEAHLAKTDAALLATVMVSMGALARLYVSDKTVRPPIAVPLLFWAGIGLGFLIKGPIILMVVGLTILALVAVDRRIAWLKELRPLIGVPLALLIVLPWLIAILSLAGEEFLSESVGRDLIGKLFDGQEGHAAPPGTHFALFWFIFWPGAFLAALAAPWVWQHRADAAVRFCLAWLIPTFLAFEIVTTKLPHYPLPTYPAIALLIGGAMAAGGLALRPPWTRIVALAAAIAPLLVVGALVLGFRSVPDMTQPLGIVGAVAAVAASVAAIVAALRDNNGLTIAYLGAAAFALYVAILGSAIPSTRLIWPSPRVAAAIEHAVPCEDPAIASTGFDEASLLFHAGSHIEFLNPKEAASFLGEGGCRVALVDIRFDEAFRAELDRQGVTAEKAATVDGISIGVVRPLSIGVYQPESVPAP